MAALVAGIDTQAEYFRYVIRAFGYGDAEESWLVQCGTVRTFPALDDLLWRSVYTDAQGNEYKVKAAVIDAMGVARTVERLASHREFFYISRHGILHHHPGIQPP